MSHFVKKLSNYYQTFDNPLIRGDSIPRPMCGLAESRSSETP